MTEQVSLAERIRDLRRELAALEQPQHDDLVLRIVTAYEPGALLTVRGLWAQPDLRTAFEDAGIHSPQQLGIWLRRSGLSNTSAGRTPAACGVSVPRTDTTTLVFSATVACNAWPMDLLDIPIRYRESTVDEILNAKSVDYVRWLASMALLGNRSQASERFLARWPKALGASEIRQEVELGHKAAVAPGSAGGTTWGSQLVGVAALSEGFAKIARSHPCSAIPGLRSAPVQREMSD